MECYRCRKEMSMNGSSFSAASFGFKIESEMKDEEIDFAKEQFGRFFDDAQKEGGVAFCLECLIESFMR